METTVTNVAFVVDENADKGLVAKEVERVFASHSDAAKRVSCQPVNQLSDHEHAVWIEAYKAESARLASGIIKTGLGAAAISRKPITPVHCLAEEVATSALKAYRVACK